MPSFGDSIFLFVLALLLFGPKKLPVLARELGKWVGEFRRASNEFKMQMEEELRQVEQADRQKQIAAMEAAAPIAPPIDSLATPGHPHLPTTAETGEAAPPLSAPDSSAATSSVTVPEDTAESTPQDTTATTSENWHPEPEPKDLLPAAEGQPAAPEPLPIAVSGNLRIMPPSTGLPTARTRPDPLGGLLDSIPESSPSSNGHSATTAVAVVSEGEAHGR